MNDQQREHLDKLGQILQKRLNILEEQAANFGPYAPPYILTEIKDIREQIKSIERPLSDSIFSGTLETEPIIESIHNLPEKVPLELNPDTQLQVKKSPPNTGNLVVLVHGLGADAKNFWGSSPVALMTHPSLHNKFDVRFWSYQTTKGPVAPWSKFQQNFGVGLRPQTLDQLGQHLWSDLREWFSKKPYTHIKLLGHSMGGLVVASAVGYGLQLQEARDANLIAALQGIAFVATPLGGASLAEVVKPIYKFVGDNIHRSDLEENSISRKSIVTRFIQLALEKQGLPLQIFRAAEDSVVNEEELTRPLSHGSYKLDIFSGGHSQCIQNLEAGARNLNMLIRWITSNVHEL